MRTETVYISTPHYKDIPWIVESYRKQLELRAHEERNMTVNINTKWNALCVHRQTIERMEMLEDRNVKLLKSLTEKGDRLVCQEKIIQELQRDIKCEHGTRNALIMKCEELENEIKAQEALATCACDDAAEHIKKQSEEITKLRKVNTYLLDGCPDGFAIPSYRTIKKQYIEAITKIELLKVRLANCEYYAELALESDDPHVLGRECANRRYLRNIVIEAKIGADANQATNTKTGEVFSTPPYEEMS